MRSIRTPTFRLLSQYVVDIDTVKDINLRRSDRILENTEETHDFSWIRCQSACDADSERTLDISMDDVKIQK